MKEMLFNHGYARSEEKLRVVYIEYHDNRPHAVICTPVAGRGTQRNFDFEVDCHDDDALMYYHSGSGGLITDIQAPHYREEYTEASYWMHPDASFKAGTDAINCVRISKPIKINGDPNPFNEHNREIYGQDYCKFCKKWYDEDSCPEHHVFEDGELRYLDGSEIDN